MTTFNHSLPQPTNSDVTKARARRGRRAWFAALIVVAILAATLVVISEMARNRGWTTIPDSRVKETNFSHQLALDRQGNTWVTMWTGLGRLSPAGQWVAYHYPGYWSLPSAPAIDTQGQVWVTNGPNLVRLSPDGQWTDYALKDSGLKFFSAGAAAVDAQDRVWVATDAGLIGLSPDGRWTTYTTHNSGLVDDSVTRLAVDQDGRMWIGTFHGLSVLDARGQWVTYTTGNSGLVNNEVWAVARDSQGRVWIGSSGGLNLLSADGQWTTPARPASSYPTVRTLAVDSQDRLWLGNTDGLHVREPDGRWTSYTSANAGLVTGGVGAIALNPQGRASLGTDEAVLLFDQSAAVPPATVTALIIARWVALAVLALMVVATGAWAYTRNRKAYPAKVTATPPVSPAASPDAALPAGKAARLPPTRLARLSLVSGLVSPVLLYGVGVLSVFVIMDDSGALHRDQPWFPIVVMVLAWVALLLPILALITGMVAFRRLHWGAEAKSRLAALVGLGLGGLLTVLVDLPNIFTLARMVLGSLGQ